MLSDIAMKNTDPKVLESIAKVIATVERLRAPNGCPWDREQTHQSLRKHLIEEAYEVLDVLDELDPRETPHSTKQKANFLEEWGDVLLQILLHAEISNEGATFGAPVGLGEIAETLNNKLIVRHPHVFEKERAMTPAEVLEQWGQIKTKSKPQGDSVFDGIKNGLPPIHRTLAVIKAVSKVGFQWDDWEGPIDKVREETEELKQALLDRASEKSQDAIESELGDLLFSVLNVAHIAKVDPEAALRGCLRRFEDRFRRVEIEAKSQDRKLTELSLKELDTLWEKAKQAIRASEKEKRDV
jgi:tetrapyrrole methylase family protein / MazG family protein